MKVLCIFVSLVVAVKAGYHEEVGIPLAARIKAYEDRIFAEGRESQLRIVGGDVAPAFAHPYVVGLIIRLKSDYVSACGSSLITTTRLVTSGHCVDFARSLKAVVGSQYLYHGGERIVTYDFKAHPRFNESNSLDYDIGIVNLPQPVEITETVHTISLPNNQFEEEIIGEWAVTAGWGLTKDNDLYKAEDPDVILNDVRVKIVEEMSCFMIYQSFRVLGSMVCTSGAGGKGTCVGDSGGPLVVERNRRKILVGVISHGHIPCKASLPSVYARVKTFRDFILQK